MFPTNPQFLYLILILPSLFGITLIGEGIHKVANEEYSGMISIVFGLVFIGLVVFVYLFFGNFMKYHH